jgi:hypothetical protein
MQSTSVTRREVTLIGLYVALEAGFSEGVLLGITGKPLRNGNFSGYVGQATKTWEHGV